MTADTIELRNLDRGVLIDVDHGQEPQNKGSEPQMPPAAADAAAAAAAEYSSLPPVDTGREAWLFLTACWFVEAFTFGFGFSFGVFQDYYSSHSPFAGSGNIAVIGTTTSGILYLGTPFVVAICRSYPRWTRWSTLAGLFATSMSLALSSFCASVPQLIGTQGVIFGIGGCVAYCPSTLYIDEWFARRKGMAYGIVWSAAGVGGVVLPLVFEILLDRYGFKTAMRIWSAVMFAGSAPLAYFIKPRLPYSANINNKRSFNMRFVISRRFMLHQIVNVIQATGYFLPGIFLPIYARMHFGTSSFLSTLTVMLMNVAVTMGLVIMGLLSDRLRPTTCMLISAVGAAVSVLLVWGFSATLPALYVFCILYGLFAGGWAAIWPGIMKEVSQSGEADGYGLTDPVMVHGHLCVGRGVGNVVSGPLSDVLVRGMPWKGKSVAGYGSGYGGLILYIGLTGLVSGINYLWQALNLL
ncbi:hypothetical protein G7054_g12867 [Neopestalotiopsis clavispora]|nr:hypothetical protein G7054_g12867 [Neopestalotiopsis clavispora]